MRRLLVVLSILAVALLGVLAAGRLTIVGAAQDGTPPAGAEAPGDPIVLETLAFDSVQSPPVPAAVALLRLTLAPGEALPITADDPSLGLVYVESGTLTFEVEVPISVTRGAAMAEANPPVTRPASEEIAAGTASTLEPTDSALFPPSIAGEWRNDGDVPVVILIAIIAPEQGDAPASSPAAGAVDEISVAVGDRNLRVACAGSGGPTVLLEDGGPNPDGGASFVASAGPDLAAALGTRFCSYDRAGTGQSDPDPMGVRTVREAAADLNAVLASPELGCPCVVVGASLGGAIAQEALAADDAGFAGLVLLDAPFPGYLDRAVELAEAAAATPSAADTAYNAGENEERLDVITGFRQLAAPAAPPAIPVIVVSHGAGDPPVPCFECPAGYPIEELEAAWQAGQAALAEALGGRLVVAEGTGHNIGDENPALTVGLVSEVVAAVRDPSTWATPVATPGA